MDRFGERPAFLKALDQAQATRLAGAQLRAAIRAGSRRDGALRAADAVREGGSSMRFFDLLTAIPRVGEMQARNMLGRAKISPVARVNDDLIGEQRRTLLVGLLVALANGPKQ
jgi:hypothetical protein